MTIRRSAQKVIGIAAVILITAAMADAATPTRLGEGNGAQEAREIKMTARKFVFAPNSITVRKGEHVRLVITSEDVDHGIAIKEFDVDQVIKAKQTTVVEFTADKEGKFEFFCSVFCGDGHPDMVGELIVTSGKPGQSASTEMKVRFDESNRGVVIVQSGGETVRIDTNTRTVTTLADTESAGSVKPQAQMRPSTKDSGRNKGSEPYDSQRTDAQAGRSTQPKPSIYSSIPSNHFLHSTSQLISCSDSIHTSNSLVAVRLHPTRRL